MPEFQVYVGNKTCYVLKNGMLVEAFKVGKRKFGELTDYFRAETLLSDNPTKLVTMSDEDKRKITGNLSSMKLLADFRHQFLYVKEFDMHFDGLAKKIEKMGELAVGQEN